MNALKDPIKKGWELFELMVSALKWGSVAGGVYLLWTVLKPKKETPSGGGQ
jgi:hypothetical protein